MLQTNFQPGAKTSGDWLAEPPSKTSKKFSRSRRHRPLPLHNKHFEDGRKEIRIQSADVCPLEYTGPGAI
jgi:hypothetical protein